MFFRIRLPFKFVWLHLMFPVAFLFVLMHQSSTPATPPPQKKLIASDLAASQPFWFSKAPEHETETLNMGQIFYSLIFPSRFPSFSKPLRFFIRCLFLISWWCSRQACNRQLVHHGTAANMNIYLWGLFRSFTAAVKHDIFFYTRV